MDGIILDYSKKSAEEIEKYDFINQDTDTNQSDEDTGAVVKKRVMTDVYISDKELEKLKESYSKSIVQDFVDDYHLSEVEREAIREKNEKFFLLRKKFTKKIRKLDKFVEAYRLCLDILDDVANNNGVYPPEKFKKKVFKGEIVVYGLNFPKYVGNRKKDINWQYIAEFIDDRTKDPKELVKNDEIDFDPECVEPEDKLHKLFSDDELERIFRKPDEQEKQLRTRSIVDPDPDSCEIAESSTKKESKAFVKMSPVILRELKDERRLEKKNRRISHASYNLDESEFDFISEYDKKNKAFKEDKMPEFTGDIMNDDDVEKYLFAMDEYERNHILVDYHGKKLTIQEKNEMDIKELLEASGWNLKNCYNNREKEKRMKKALKKDKKREKRLKNMLKEVQLRKDLRSGKISEDDLKKLNKKDKKKKSKKKKRKKKAKKAMDGIFLDIADTDDYSFKSYKKKMKEF